MASERREDVKVIREDGYEHRQRVVEHSPSMQNVIMSRLNQLIWLLTIVVEFLIGFRIILKVVAANPINGFANFIYGVTYIFIAPFASILQNPALNDTGSVLELTSLIAMLVYFIIALIITALIRILLLDTSSRSVKTVERT
jgi:hypothetical protein